MIVRFKHLPYRILGQPSGLLQVLVKEGALFGMAASFDFVFLGMVTYTEDHRSRLLLQSLPPAGSLQFWFQAGMSLTVFGGMVALLNSRMDNLRPGGYAPF